MVTALEKNLSIPNLAMIACVSRDGGLGNEGELLWQIPADMQFFRQTTLNSTVIMGRKTFTSIGRPLPRRRNIVLSRHEVQGEGIEWCSSMENLISLLMKISGQKFIIGGSSLYEAFLPYSEKLYLTEVNAIKPADTYFPKWTRADFTKQILQSGLHDGLQYQIIEYTRKGLHGRRKS